MNKNFYFHYLKCEFNITYVKSRVNYVKFIKFAKFFPNDFVPFDSILL